MLIKVVAANGDIHIIENVQDVSVKAGMQDFFPYKSLDELDYYQRMFFEHGDYEGQESKYSVREINYAKDGPCRLYICNLAYICTDEGKTIEKVVAGPAVV